MGRTPRVLVVYKKDPYQQYLQDQRDPHLRQLLRRKHPDVMDMQRAHVVHEAAFNAVARTLRAMPVEVEFAYRANLRVRRRYTLVVSVGGDGTFLHAAHAITSTPILGVNSDTARSEAVFCAATPRTFPRLIRRALAGTLPLVSLYRVSAYLNGQPVPTQAVNDVLVAHDDPATMSRYRLRIGGREEFQKSSGIWVATAAGSSSAVGAAGGRRLAWSTRRFQYRPRELYRGRLSHNRMTGGVLRSSACVRLTWLMRRGVAFIDGPHVRVPLRFADELEIRLSTKPPLEVLGLGGRRPH